MTTMLGQILIHILRNGIFLIRKLFLVSYLRVELKFDSPVKTPVGGIE